ncbi:MAG: flavin reductase family protein, partial [Oscillospiraceae bacterium]|nr:flavin reductase family protein [Oscillospiraceae bacterium]
MNSFKSVNPEQLSDNMFKLIAKDWTLITAGNVDSYNMMTANWLGVGYLWMKHVAFVFIRPTRYTYEFTEKLDEMSLNFFTEDYREVLNLCGKKSGREINKPEECKLSPIAL